MLIKPLLIAVLCLTSVVGFAHGLIHPNQSVWQAWIYTPAVAIPLFLTLVIYLRGRAKRREAGKPVGMGRTVTFLLGMLCFVIALQSPLEPRGIILSLFMTYSVVNSSCRIVCNRIRQPFFFFKHQIQS